MSGVNSRFVVFTLQTQRKLDASTDVQLIVVRALDRESLDLYKVKVVAYDGGSPPRSGTVDVEVIVTDANDNGPVFEYSSYEVTVAENIDVGTTVAKVTAFDADAGINAEVSDVSVMNFNKSSGVFTARVYARAVLRVVILFVRPSVRLSVSHTRGL